MRFSAVAVVALCLVAVACSDDKKNDPPDPYAAVSEEIDSAQGGSISLEDGSFTVDIPAGALASDTTISIRQLRDDEIPAWVPDRMAPVVELLPDGLVFTTPVSLAWTLPESAGVRDGRLVFAVAGSLDDANQRIVPASTKIAHSGTNVVVTETVSHFSNHTAFFADKAGVENFAGLGLDVGFPENNDFYVGDSFLPTVALVSVSGDAYDFEVEGKSINPALHVRSFPGHPRSSEFSATSPEIPVTFIGANDTVSLVGPIFTCKEAVDGAIYVVAVKFEHVFLASQGAGGIDETIEFEAEEGGVADCLARPETTKKDDQVNVAETQRVVNEGGAMVASGQQGVAFNILQAASEISDILESRDPGITYNGVPGFPNAPGPDEFAFTTPNQTFSANRVGDGYQPVGLAAGGGLWNSGGELTVTGNSLAFNQAWSETVPVPSDIPTNVIETIDGLNSTLAISSSLTFDGVYVTGSGSSPTPGNAGFGVFIPRSAMTETAGVLRGRMIPQGIVDALTADQVDLDDIYVGLVNQTTTNAWFDSPRATDVRAMSAIVFHASELGGTTNPGNYTVEQCNELPGEFVSVDADRTAVLCINPGTFCFVSNNTYEDAPLAPSQCSGPNGHRAFQMNSSGGNVTISGGNWPLVWASTGITSGYVMTDPPASTPLRAIVRQPAARAFYDVNFSYVGTTMTVNSAVPYDAPALPVYGAQHHCASLPQTFGTPVTDGDDFARICLGYYGTGQTPGECFVLGDVNATAETEFCPTASLPLRFRVVSGNPTISRSNSGWQITGISSGTNSASTATGFAADTNVTITVDGDPAGTTTVVFSYNASSGYTIVSVDDPGLP